MDKEKFLKSGLIEQYVLGIATDEEAKLVEAFAEQYPEVKSEIESLRAGLEDYAKQYSIDPPGDLKGKIMEEIDELELAINKNRRIESNLKRSRAFSFFASVAALIFLAAGLFLFRQKTNLEDKLSRAEATNAVIREQCQKTSSQNRELLAFLYHKDTRTIHLKGTELAPEAEAIVYYNPVAKKAMLNPVTMPDIAKNQSYQIWADVNGDMIDMGVFNPKSSDLQPVSFIELAQSFNISLEPKGGSDHPTLSLIYLNGDI